MCVFLEEFVKQLGELAQSAVEKEAFDKLFKKQLKPIITLIQNPLAKALRKLRNALKRKLAAQKRIAALQRKIKQVQQHLQGSATSGGQAKAKGDTPGIPSPWLSALVLLLCAAVATVWHARKARLSR